MMIQQQSPAPVAIDSVPVTFRVEPLSTPGAPPMFRTAIVLARPTRAPRAPVRGAVPERIPFRCRRVCKLVQMAIARHGFQVVIESGVLPNEALIVLEGEIPGDSHADDE